MSYRITLAILIVAALVDTPLWAQQVLPHFLSGDEPVTWLHAGDQDETLQSPSPQACRIDACEALPEWEDATSATVRISNGCTGVLLNNTNQDHKPYILTAHHCGRPAVGQTVNWTFHFNDQVQDCFNPQPPTSSDTMQGAVVRAAKGGYNDYVLLELLEPIPSEYNVHFAGWSIVDAGSTSLSTRPTSGMVFGHPQGDLKKLTKDDDPINHYGTTHWVGLFDHGTIEVGSSGSPLFNEHHQVVGLVRAALQMKDECSGPEGDDNEAVVLFPKLSYNWDAGAEGERLSEFLDSAGTGAQSMESLDSGASVVPDGSSTIWINEINAFGRKRQTDEYIEIVGPSGTRLTDYEIDIYSCSNGVALLQASETIDAFTLGHEEEEFGVYLIGGSSRKLAVDQQFRNGADSLPDGSGLVVLRDDNGAEVFAYQYDDTGRACPSEGTTRSVGDAAGPGSIGFLMKAPPSSDTKGVQLLPGTPGTLNVDSGQLRGSDQLLKEEAAAPAAQGSASLEVVDRFALMSPYPNPFNPQTSFSLEVPVAQAVSVAVYNLLGRRVAVLHEGTMQAHQTHSFVWDAGSYPSGVYLIRVVGEQFTQTRRVTLLK